MTMAKTVRYLTKSRFKLGMECPAKLFYTGKDTDRNQIYANSKMEDDFLPHWPRRLPGG